MKGIIVKIISIMAFAVPAFANEKPYAPDNIPGATTITADDIVEMLLTNPALIVIDSRKHSEYVKGHIEGAINILNTSLNAATLQSVAPSKSTHLVFYCNGLRCLRSADSVKKALSWGYTNVFWFRGGWKEWRDKRLPVLVE